MKKISKKKNSAKKNLALFFNLSFAITSCAFCDIDPDDIGAKHEDKADERGPFHVEMHADYVSKAKVKDSEKFHKLTFGSAQIEAGAIYYYDPCYEEGANVTVFYENTLLDWDSNPNFKQEDYSAAGFTLGGFSKRLPDWTWKGQLVVNFDNLKHWTFSDYMYYNMLLWGRYEVCDNVGLHIGFLGETGMKIDRVYPVIGFDWTYNCHWKINAIFPVNMSVVYTLNPTWSFALAGRVFDERSRVGKHEHLSEGLWHYQQSGAELAVFFTPTKKISANLHVGTTFAGHLKIADKHYHHGSRVHLEGSPYAGGELDIKF